MPNKQSRTASAAAVVKTLERLPDQFIRAWDETSQRVLPRAYRRPRLVAVCGMGGSNLATELIQSVYGASLTAPLLLVRDYALPAAVTRDSVVIIVSYSGDTAETLACYDQARERGARIVCLTVGGELRRRALIDGVPLYLLDRRGNPSGQPRYAIATQVAALLAIFSHLQLIGLHRQDIVDITTLLQSLTQTYQPANSDTDNTARESARILKNKFPLIFAGEHLSANAHIIANQLNESAKTLAVPCILPEYNHHGLEGLERPAAAARQLIGLYLTSSWYTPVIAQRAQITQQVMRKLKIPCLVYELDGNSPLAMAMEVLCWGSWVSYYLAQEHGVDPADVPWVHFLKSKLT